MDVLLNNIIFFILHLSVLYNNLMKIVVDDLCKEKRLDSYLADYMQGFSRSKISDEIKKGSVLVNNKEVKPSYTVKNDDIIEFNIKDSVLKIEPENLPLQVVYEDDNMAVINKPSGMLTHPTTTEISGTLVNALLFTFGENLSDINGEFRRGIIHRLDRNTSGLLMIAKNNKTHEYLVEKMKKHEISKNYLAIVKGVINENEFVINKPIRRNPSHPEKMGVYEDGKESISEVKVIKRFKDATFIEVHLITGRTHQIRVHLSSIGHPVYNDTLYGFGKMKIKTDEQVLQSYKLSFPKPFSNEILSFKIEPDEKIKKVLKFLEG